MVNQKRFATSTNREQQLQMFSMHSLMGKDTDGAQFPRVLVCCHNPNSQEYLPGPTSDLELNSQWGKGIIMNWRSAVAAGFQGSLKQPLVTEESKATLQSHLPHLLPLSCSSPACKTKWLEMCRVL